jgi:hypothetical protein
MPWHLENDHPDCEGFAVVKDEGNELVGCHRTRAQALNQLAALNIAEPDAGDQEDRAAGDPPAIVTDIDGTLLIGDSVNTALIAILDETDADVIVLTARNPDQRAQTERRLDEIGLDYETLYMVGDAGDDVTAKLDVMRRLLERYDVIAAYENRADIRAAYQELGVDARPPRSNRETAEEILAYLLPFR